MIKAIFVAPPEISITGYDEVTQYRAATFHASTTGGSVEWEFEGGVPSLAYGNTAKASWQDTGLHRVVATLTNAAGTASDTMFVSVVPPEFYSVNIQCDGYDGSVIDTIVDINQQGNLCGQTVSIPNGNTITLYTYCDTTIYYIRNFIVNGVQHASELMASIEENGMTSFSFPVTSMTNVQLTIVEKQYEGIGVSSQGNCLFSIKPNPANGTVHIDIADMHDKARVTVVDISGRVVSEQFTTDGMVSVDGLPSGVYMVKVETSALTATKRLVVY